MNANRKKLLYDTDKHEMLLDPLVAPGFGRTASMRRTSLSYSIIKRLFESLWQDPLYHSLYEWHQSDVK